MLKCSKVYKNQIMRSYSKSNKKIISDFLKKKKLGTKDEAIPREDIKPSKTQSAKTQDVNSVLSKLKPIKMDNLSTEDALSSPIFAYRNKQNKDEVKRLQYKNALKLKNLENERKKYNIALGGNTKADMYMFMKGKEQYEKWLKFTEKIKKIDPKVGALQNELIKYYRVEPEDEYKDSKLLYQYTGSDKGPRPEDDPLYFAEWYKKNLSDSAFRFISAIEHADEVEIATEQEESVRGYADYTLFLNSKGLYVPLSAESIIENAENPSETDKQDSEKSTKNILSKTNLEPKESPEEKYMQEEEEKEDPEENIEYVIDIPSELPDYLELPFSTVATEVPDQFQKMMLYQTNWNVMVQCLGISHFVKNIDRIIEEETKKTETEEYKNRYYNTLWGYYNLLPEKIKESPHVKMTLLALERRGYFLTLEEKQEMLNKACITTLDVTEGNLNRGYNVS